ncbi:MAG: group II truncated hemoglobin [Methylophilales bacterium]|nr:group II truncated hemoglobin [Methylophilales bacterium]
MLLKIPTEPGTTTFYELLGSKPENIRTLVEKFYDIMDTDTKAAGVRAMHPADLTSAREKLFMFLTGWTGGPQLYIERYGHPMLRRRHLPFVIGESERDQWMYCMVRAMHEIELAEPVIVKLSTALWDVADFMRNQP